MWMLQEARAETQRPNRMVQEERRSSANVGALRPSNGASENPESVKKRDMFLQSKIHQKDIAKMLKVSQYTVSKIKKRHNLPTERFE